mgnify:CR=1 FL=1
MAVINQRLTNTAIDLNLHAPPQAGFRAHHSTTEQVLLLQTVIQHSVKTKNLLCLAFIDFKNAEDSIDRAKLW